MDKENPSRELDAEPKSIVKGNWRLDIYFRLRGSKSEGQHGILFYNGEPVEPNHVAEVIETDLGMMKYYCYLENMIFSFELTGWNYSDTEKIKPSWSEKL